MVTKGQMKGGMDLKDIMCNLLLKWCDINGQQHNTDVDSFLLPALDSSQRDHATSSIQSYELLYPLASFIPTCNPGVQASRPYTAPKTDQEIVDTSFTLYKTRCMHNPPKVTALLSMLPLTQLSTCGLVPMPPTYPDGSSGCCL